MKREKERKRLKKKVYPVADADRNPFGQGFGCTWLGLPAPDA